MRCSGFLRFLATLLHLGLTVATGVCIVYSLIRWNSFKECLPPSNNVDNVINKLLPNGSSICTSILGFLVVTCFLNLSMAAFTNCLWKNSCFMFLHLFLALAITACSVFAASLMMVYKWVWCDHLTDMAASDMDCTKAAEHHDSHFHDSNMTLYNERLHLQVVGLWSLAPIAFCAVLCYGLILLVLPTQGVPPRDVVVYRIRGDEDNMNIKTLSVMDYESIPLLNESRSRGDDASTTRPV